ncbi:hypothetical protein CCR94_24020 [Rhodoblastus sphagnicola]|uniref:Uncharacterized protein n=1 Tax=Rhodoblastus sphagnicola TaxID=333368 RepID=A0A2S6MU02_9HYPH|nr:hypothetical protein [Rhodoblastus sphagnicola]MBB4199781.1 hypothetical protein [Rhodoblastus sphagnicola]PPQ25841.1 hypothetical protein CCR94_24020 [Rhodoblastus sphagnicola]
MKARREINDLAGALARAAEALRLTSSRLSRVEVAVGEILRQSETPPAGHFTDVQQLDLSVQEVAAIAEFIGQLARQMQRGVAVDLVGATQPVRLHDLAAYLTGRQALASMPRDSADDEDIFFTSGG